MTAPETDATIHPTLTPADASTSMPEDGAPSEPAPEMWPEHDDSTPLRDRKWTAVLFVHGMGSQRRFGDVSGLVDALDQRSTANRHAPLVGIDVDLEQRREPDAPPLTYLRARWRPAPGDIRNYPPTRFYEAYWAPVTAGGVPFREVIRWLFAQVAKPIGGLLTPWRGKARLRRAILQGFSDEEITSTERTTLVRAYDEYEGSEARRAYPAGDFDGFIKHLSSIIDASWRQKGRKANQDEWDHEKLRLLALAHRWRSRCVRTEMGNLIALMTLAVALLSAAGLVILTVTGLLVLHDDLPSKPGNLADLIAYIKLHKDSFLALGGAVLLIPGLKGGLEDSLGDVVFWTTYEETQTRYEKRHQILTEVRSYLSHLTHHPDCERIIVVAHSLGTAIAVDAILAEARDSKADKDSSGAPRDLSALRKITHVITYGSPIDKIHYFFERDPDQHRYHRVVEELRGDIGTEPFANNNGKPLIHWINFWDRADLISGVLESPTNRRHPNVRIDNVQVSRGWLFKPVRAHTGYLNLPLVVDTLADVIQHRSDEHQGRAGLSPFLLGPGSRQPHITAQILFVGTVIWAFAAVLIVSALSADLLLAAAATAVLGVLVLVVALLTFVPIAAKSARTALESFVAFFGL